MKRLILVLTAVLCLLTVTTFPTLAGYPERDITFIIPHGPGGTFDTYVRAISAALERYLPNKINVVPTNMPGANMTRAITAAYRAKPDGYTIAIFDIPGGLLAQIVGNPRPSYDLSKFTWLASIGSDQYGLAVNGSSAIKSVEDMKALGRPVKLTTTGAGTSSYMAAKIATDIMGIPSSIISGYRGSSEYIIGAIRGDGDGTIAVLPMLHKYRKSGDLRTIAVLAPTSSVAGVPDAVRLGHPELSLLALHRLIGAPPGLPENIRQILEKALLAAMKDPETVRIMAAAGAEMQPEDGARAAEILKASFDFFSRYRHYIPQP
ncbi:MAG: tripartite tricarboxylate transporter substrate binding protein [Xanthobacteraceae bacterium]|nr:MAG: tripartite tricarboxylate transporter substrate binding protein [Xanthobacteraceae bacterium]